MLTFIPFLLWFPSLYLFLLGVQIVGISRSWSAANRPVAYCAALNLCEPAINSMVVLVLYLTIDNLSFVADAAIPFAFTAPMLLVMLIGLMVWYVFAREREQASDTARHVAFQALSSGVIRYVLTTGIWLCITNTSGRGTFGTMLVVLAIVLTVLNVVALMWCARWGRNLIDASPAELQHTTS